MTDIGSALKEQISRLAKKELTAIAGPLLKGIGALKAELEKVEKAIGGLGATRGRRGRKKGRVGRPRATKGVSTEAAKARFSPQRIRAMRKKLGLSQKAMAELAGVSIAAVQSWEQGRSKPTGRNREALVEIRKMGKKEVKAKLPATKTKRRRRKKTEAAK